MSTTEILRRDQERAGRRILRMRAVEQRTGRKRSAIYESIALGTFPKSIPLGKRSVGWLENEIEDWIDDCIEAREKRNVA
jgi:prophage regulatory protein